jgi:undecaprenyl-phosphate alpha-N-acetylglucosaminyl 1-phosphatetransferase
MMINELLFLMPLSVSVIAVKSAQPLARQLGLVDRPGGRKQHEDNVPLVGGLGVFAALLVGLMLGYGPGDVMRVVPALVVGASLMFVVGMVDDRWPLHFKPRLLAQVAAAVLIAGSGEAVLRDMGDLVGTGNLPLGWLAIPVTVFCVVGVVNAFNMVDGVDGLAGGLSLVSLSLLAVTALRAGDGVAVVVAVATLAGVIGFLGFNFRWALRPKASVFLGNSGSVLVGFLLAWLLVRLSQPSSGAFSPVTALWLFAVPLIDTIAVILRRRWLGRSAFAADRTHVHHLLLDAGYRIGQTVTILMSAQLILGLTGLAGEYAGVPEWGMFVAFLAVFGLYLFFMSRPWRVVPRLRSVHRAVGLSIRGVNEIYVGPLDPARASAQAQALFEPLDLPFYRLCLGGNAVYAVVYVEHAARLGGTLRRLRSAVAAQDGVKVRQFEPRDAARERRLGEGQRNADRRRNERRSAVQLVLEDRIQCRLPLNAAAFQ